MKWPGSWLRLLLTPYSVPEEPNAFLRRLMPLKADYPMLVPMLYVSLRRKSGSDKQHTTGSEIATTDRCFVKAALFQQCFTRISDQVQMHRPRPLALLECVFAVLPN